MSPSSVYRASWIRSCSRYDRWKEELALVEAEMGWYVRFLEYRQNWALQWTTLGLGGGYDGYAFRQANMWRRLQQRARAEFKKKAGIAIPERGFSSPSVKSEEDDGPILMDVEKSEEGVKSEEGEHPAPMDVVKSEQEEYWMQVESEAGKS